MKIHLDFYEHNGSFVGRRDIDSEKEMPEDLRTESIRQLFAGLLFTQFKVPMGYATNRGILLVSTEAHPADMVHFILQHELGHVAHFDGITSHFDDLTKEIAADKYAVAKTSKKAAVDTLTLMKKSLEDTLKRCENTLTPELSDFIKKTVALLQQRINQIT